MQVSEQSIKNAKAYLSVVTNREKIKELQKKADAAYFALCVHSSILYGLLEGNPSDIDTIKSQAFLEEASKYGITPNKF